MGFFDTAKIFIKGGKIALDIQKKATPNLWTDTAQWGNSLNKNNFATEEEQLTAYENLLWASACVDVISLDAGNRDYWFSDQANKKIDNGKIDENIIAPILNGFANNSILDMIQTIIAQRLLTGNAYLLKARKTAYGFINEINEQFIPIAPHMAKTIKNSTETQLLGYEIKFKGGTKIKVKPEDVIHFKQNTLYNPYDGIGNIEKAHLVAQNDLNTSNLQNEYLSNKAAPSMIITDESNRQLDDIERYIDMINEKYTGNRNTGKIMYLAGQNLKATIANLNQKDMEIIASKKFNKQSILAIFGVPGVRLGIEESVNRATAEWLMYIYYNNINQVIKQIENTINNQHIWLFDRNINIRFKKHITADVKQVKEMLQNGIITPNQAAEMTGQESNPEDEARNAYYLSSTLLPISLLGTEIEDEKNEKRTDNPEFRKIDVIVKEFEEKSFRERKFQARYLRSSLKTRFETIQKYTPRLNEFFREQGNRIVKAFNEKFVEKSIKELNQESVRVIFDIDTEDIALLSVVKKFHTSAIQKAIMDINIITSATVNPNLSNPNVKWAIQRLSNLITNRDAIRGNFYSVNMATRKMISNIIVKGANANLPITEISSNIQKKFDIFQGYRGRLIARTEARAAWDTGAIVGYKELDVKTVDVIGCEGTSVDGDYGTLDELDTDCGKTNIPIDQAFNLYFHPNHIGAVVPSEKP